MQSTFNVPGRSFVKPGTNPSMSQTLPPHRLRYHEGLLIIDIQTFDDRTKQQRTGLDQAVIVVHNVDNPDPYPGFPNSTAIYAQARCNITKEMVLVLQEILNKWREEHSLAPLLQGLTCWTDKHIAPDYAELLNGVS